MRILILLAAALVLAALASATAARAPTAQTSPEENEACRSGKATIPAADLSKTVRLEDCPLSGRVITDNGVGTVLPAPGQSIYVDSLTTDGSQELEVTRYRDGTVELKYVGDESEEARAEPEISAAARGPGECSDGAYEDLDRKVYADLRWYFNRKSTPKELSRKRAVRAISKGTANITNTRNSCRLGDGVPWGMSYAGSTRARAQLDAGGHCSGNDGMTVVSFGRLPKSALAVTCTVMAIEDPYNRTKWSDIMLNKTHRNWTTRPNARSCRGSYDLVSTVTHERGHTFGLGHVAERYHRNLTMSDRSNGPCQSSERSLGRGDVLGLANKY